MAERTSKESDVQEVVPAESDHVAMTADDLNLNADPAPGQASAEQLPAEETEAPAESAPESGPALEPQPEPVDEVEAAPAEPAPDAAAPAETVDEDAAEAPSEKRPPRERAIALNQHPDGTVTIAGFPQRTRVSEEMVRAARQAFSRSGDTLTITADNGSATYRILESSAGPHGSMLVERVGRARYVRTS
jgi:hypothetical protein